MGPMTREEQADRRLALIEQHLHCCEAEHYGCTQWGVSDVRWLLEKVKRPQRKMRFGLILSLIGNVALLALLIMQAPLATAQANVQCPWWFYGRPCNEPMIGRPGAMGDPSAVGDSNCTMMSWAEKSTRVAVTFAVFDPTQPSTPLHDYIPRESDFVLVQPFEQGTDNVGREDNLMLVSETLVPESFCGDHRPACPVAVSPPNPFYDCLLASGQIHR